MEQFFVTKKKYDWIVKHNGEEYDLTEERGTAIESARARARDVMGKGGEAEILVANEVGMWDKIAVD